MINQIFVLIMRLNISQYKIVGMIDKTFIILWKIHSQNKKRCFIWWRIQYFCAIYFF